MLRWHGDAEELQPGTFAANWGLAECTSCEAGTFQSHTNTTACEACPRFRVCPQAASAPLPCPGGTHLTRRVGVTVKSEDDCNVVSSGQ